MHSLDYGWWKLHDSAIHIGTTLAVIRAEPRRTQVTPGHLRTFATRIASAKTLEQTQMKTLMFALCILCASVAWGQSAAGASAMSAEPVITQFYSHPRPAVQSGMAVEARVLERSTAVSGRGVLPLWEFATVSHETPLGDIARELRQQHETSKKAARVVTN